MTDGLDDVRDHYRATGLTERLKEALKIFGPEDQQLLPEQLAALDQFHSRGLAATTELAQLAGITAAASVLDVGSGVGGPARVLAATYGCEVIGIDLSEPFVDAARYLTERTGQGRMVSFQVASALALPFEDNRFDNVLLQHVAMNISDRVRLYREIRRVLKLGRRFATFDVVLKQGDRFIRSPGRERRQPALCSRLRQRARRPNRLASAPLPGKTTPRPQRPGSPSCARPGRRHRPTLAWCWGRISLSSPLILDETSWRAASASLLRCSRPRDVQRVTGDHGCHRESCSKHTLRSAGRVAFVLRELDQARLKGSPPVLA